VSTTFEKKNRDYRKYPKTTPWPKLGYNAMAASYRIRRKIKYLRHGGDTGFSLNLAFFLKLNTIITPWR
jgi:hypothetical protein